MTVKMQHFFSFIRIALIYDYQPERVANNTDHATTHTQNRHNRTLHEENIISTSEFN
jgi:hypothetical protein